MAIITIQDMLEARCLPCTVMDRHGEVIRRAIRSFDCDTGLVCSYVLDTEGRHILTRQDALTKRVEQYDAPLTYRKATLEEYEQHEKLLLDREGK